MAARRARKKKMTKKKTRAAKKVKKAKKVVRKKKVARKVKRGKGKKTKAAKRTAKKAKKPAKKKVAFLKKPTAKKKARAKKAAVIGKVVHYYDRIGVAIVELAEAIRLGDLVRLKRGKAEFTQKISSLQINHQPIEHAAKGQVVGIKVDKEAREGSVLLAA
jgi:hypothetical protein